MPVITMTSITVSPSYGKPVQAPRQIVARVSSSPWLWMGLACLLLGISGGIRFWREWQFAALAAGSDRPPFHLDDLPRTLGNWESEKSKDGELDEKVAVIAGSSDSIIRAYEDKKADGEVSALVLYGRADRVFAHSPDACYPSAGYQLVKGPMDREMSVPGVKAPVRYRWSIYMKRIGGIGHYREVYHTFYFNGEWLPNASNRWKAFRYHPAMFRVLLERPMSGLSDEVYGPCEELLGKLVREINDRMSHDGDGSAEGAASVSTSPAASPSNAQKVGPG
jgi:uncharacterized protein DUF3485